MHHPCNVNNNVTSKNGDDLIQRLLVEILLEWKIFFVQVVNLMYFLSRGISPGEICGQDCFPTPSEIPQYLFLIWDHCHCCVLEQDTSLSLDFPLSTQECKFVGTKIHLLFFTAVASRNSVHNSPKFPISFPFSCTICRSCLAVSSRMLLGREQVYR